MVLDWLKTRNFFEQGLDSLHNEKRFWDKQLQATYVGEKIGQKNWLPWWSYVSRLALSTIDQFFLSNRNMGS